MRDKQILVRAERRRRIMAVKVKVKPIGLLDMLKFKNQVKEREKVIDRAKAMPFPKEYETNFICGPGGHPDSGYMQKKYPNFLRTAAYPFNTVCRSIGIPDDALDILNTYWPYLRCDCDTLTFMHYCLCVYKYIRRGAYIPRLTVHQLSNAMIERIRENGGDIWFHVKAEEIIFDKNGKICGVSTTAG